MQKNTSRKKVFVIAIPHFGWKLANMMMKEGKLKNFRKMVRNGSYGMICPQQEKCSTPVEFTSMITGVKKEKHGIGYGKYTDQEYVEGGRLYTRLDIKTKTIWEIALEHGKKVGIYNWLLTWPPKKINGFMITGRLTQDKTNRTYPKVLSELMEHTREPDFFDDEIAIALIKKYDVDLFLGMEERTHGPTHELWEYIEPVKGSSKKIKEIKTKREEFFSLFEKVDSFLGKIQAEFPEATIMVVSDSGMKPRPYPIYTLGNEVIDFFQKLNIGIQLYATDVYPPTLPKAKPTLYLPGKSENEKKRIVKILNEIRYKQNGEKFIQDVIWKGNYLSFSFNFHPSFVGYKSNWFHLILPDSEEFRMWVIKQTGSSHSKGGVFAIKSPLVKKGYLGEINTVDVAPTIFHLLDIPIPGYFDGKSIVGD